MENVKNIISSFLIITSSAISFIEEYTIYARAVAATLAIIVSLMTVFRWYKENKK